MTNESTKFGHRAPTYALVTLFAMALSLYTAIAQTVSNMLSIAKSVAFARVTVYSVLRSIVLF